MPTSRLGRVGMWSGVLLAVTFSLGGCELSCRSETDGSVAREVDEIGDEVKDAVDEVKKDIRSEP